MFNNDGKCITKVPKVIAMRVEEKLLTCHEGKWERIYEILKLNLALDVGHFRQCKMTNRSRDVQGIVTAPVIKCSEVSDHQGGSWTLINHR